MHLRQIFMNWYEDEQLYQLDPNQIEQKLNYKLIFNGKLFVIGYYLTKQVRKLKFETDDFTVINILCGAPENYVKKFLDFMDIGADFDFVKFDSLSRRDRCIYAIEVLKDALYRFSKIKTIPYEQICKICDDLVEADFVFSWKFCGLRLPEHRLKVRFESVLTTSDYKINIIVHRYGDKTPLCQGQVIRTEPDDVCFDFISRKIQVEDDRLVFYASWNEPLMYLRINDLCNGVIRPLFPKPRNPNDTEDTEMTLRFQKKLAYDGHHYD